MGGLLILTAALVPTLLWADLTNAYVWIAVVTTAGFGAIGFRRRLPEDRPPVASRAAAALQDGLADARSAPPSASSLLVLAQHRRSTTRGSIFPFFKRLIPDLGWAYLPFAVVRAGRRESNAVNLTDGLDGLAISTFAIAAAAYTALAYVTGHRVLAEYLLLVRFPPAGGADDLLRRARRRVASGSFGTTRTRPRSSWATSGRWRSAPRSARSRS